MGVLFFHFRAFFKRLKSVATNSAVYKANGRWSERSSKTPFRLSAPFMA